MNFSSPSIEVLLRDLQSSPQGLSLTRAKALQRLSKHRNKPESRIKKEIRLFVRQFTNPLILILIIVIVLSILLKERSDVFIISVIILLTGVLSFIQELNAGRASEKLLALIKTKHTIMREGKLFQVSAEEIVSGDILLFDAGDIIPADCRIIESNELHVNESSLTGESFPAEKYAGELPEDTPLSSKRNCLWQGTSVISGTAKAVAVSTGEETILGQMQKGLRKEPLTAFEQGITRFGFFLLRITVLLSVFILLTNLYFGKPFFVSMLFSLALAIGMAPELLPAIMTVTMSAGAREMMKEKVVVKKLSSIFNFGEVSVLCTDKTGTITEGSIRVIDVVNPDGNADPQVRFYAFLNSYFEKGFNNPIDEAIRGLQLDASGYSRTDEIPYDFIRKRLSVAVKKGDETLLLTKGAVEQVLPLCSSFRRNDEKIEALESTWISKIKETFASYARQGIRVLALSYKPTKKEQVKRDDEADMIFAGFILIEDPLKENVTGSIQKLRDLDIEVKIITGDNRFAALHTASELGFPEEKVITGAEINSMSPEALQHAAPSTFVFAEIEPHQKERIVRALQKSGLAIAYLGDGINDVAAIHAADTGISTNNAVDVAKEAADFVLMEKDLSVLANGIYLGRKSFANSMKYIFVNTGSTFGNMFSVAGASLLLPFLPLLPQQILFTNVITNTPFLSIASDKVDESDSKHPLKWDIAMIRKFMLIFGIHSSLFDFISFYGLFYRFRLPEARFQTAWLIESIFTELLIIFVIRTRNSILKSSPGALLVVVSLLSMVITLYLPYSPFAHFLGLVPLEGYILLFLFAVILFYTITAELLKRWFFRRQSLASLDKAH